MITLSKDKYIFYRKQSGTTIYSNSTGCQFIKQVKTRGGDLKYAYYLCSSDGSDVHDSTLLTSGELLGRSNNDLSQEDVKIKL